jgi:hypothetical protein
MTKDKKQPWNPLPLHSLDVEGLSACAKTVLIYLAARSNIKGETCVGHRRMCKDLVRSKDFVTKGLAELEDKGYLITSQRGRKAREADWRVLNADLILKSRTANSSSSPDSDISSPEEQECIPICSPDFGDSSPAMQGETSYSNLADLNQTHNLTDENNNNRVDVVPQTISGFTPETIQAHVAKFPEGSWVWSNATKDALTREGFVEHVMGLEPPKKKQAGLRERRVSTSLRPVVMEFSEHFHLRGAVC